MLFCFLERKGLLSLVIHIKAFKNICLSQLNFSGHPYQNFFSKKGRDCVFIRIFHVYFNAKRQRKFPSPGDIDLVILGSMAQVIAVYINVKVGAF